jgi:hypothetical protein
LVLEGRGWRWRNGGEGIWCKYCVHTYVNGKMIYVETNPGMGGRGDEGKSWNV